MNQYILEQVMIIQENGMNHQADIWVRDGKFYQIASHIEQSDVERMKLQKDVKILPGFIDIHIHGAGGADVMDATPDALSRIASILPGEGTTSFLATTMTQAPEKISAALQTARQYQEVQQADGSAEMLGIHLEGPFISELKAGAQPAAYISAPSEVLMDEWCERSGDQIRIVTLAPETPGAQPLIKMLSERNIITSLGHSDASEAEVVQSVSAGASHVTHLYNQMSAFHHRELGLAGAALAHDELSVELIADFIHSHQTAVRLAYKAKGPDRLILITDAMRAKGLEDGNYDLGGQPVSVKGMEAKLPDGTLAGSVLTMDQAYRNVKGLLNLRDDQMIPLTSANAARALGIYDRKGSITEGKDADFVVLDTDDQVRLTVCRGMMKG